MWCEYQVAEIIGANALDAVERQAELVYLEEARRQALQVGHPPLTEPCFLNAYSSSILRTRKPVSSIPLPSSLCRANQPSIHRPISLTLSLVQLLTSVQYLYPVNSEPEAILNAAVSQVNKPHPLGTLSAKSYADGTHHTNDIGIGCSCHRLCVTCHRTYRELCVT